MALDTRLLINSVIFIVSLGAGRCQTVVTNTTLGQVMGAQLPLPGSSDPVLVITRYTGIPYAEPPIGELRFAKPVPKAPWDGVLNATEFRDQSCAQSMEPTELPALFQKFFPPTEEDEDCLFLNVYVPHKIVAASSGALPVMVWIHGGGWLVGSSTFYTGTFLALKGRVVFVNLNYRLGLFGFLSTGDDSAPGNYGLWDQRLAIQWVKDNIGSFGGDPDQITIFGESAGGWSVTAQMVSPVNNNTLFQRVISQSGAISSRIVLTGEQAKRRALTVASAVGCNRTSSRDTVSCLRDTSFDSLLSVNRNVPEAFATVDGEFLPQDIDTMLSHSRVGQYELMIGYTSFEGSLGLSQFGSNESSLSLTSDQLREKIRFLSMYCHCDNPQEITDAILVYYYGADKLDDPRGNVLKYLEVHGDIYILIPAVQFRNFHAMQSGKNPTYEYFFTYEMEGINQYDWIKGAPHASEILYVFGFTNFAVALGQLSPDAVLSVLSSTLIAYWTAFARNGNPNVDGNPEWPAFDAENETYIILDANITTNQRFQADKIAFWSNYVPKIRIPSAKPTCPYEIPTRGSTAKKPGNQTVQISSKDGLDEEKLGSVVGVLRVADKAMGGEVISQFLGIPYAKPPIGDLRFRPPQETGPWGDDPRGFLDNLPPACPQDVALDPWMVRLGFNHTSEDCLSLNIFTPDAFTNRSPLPVLVFIHPGNGVSSTSSVYDAVQLASRVKAVVVVINYRLGALGFLSTEDDASPGNYGLEDALASLKWVQKYIGSFGGDGGKVTVIGHGFGAVLAHLLTLTEKAQSLFQRAVLMSASAISPSVKNKLHPAARITAQTLAIALGCPTTSSELMINCLRKKPVDDIVRNTKNPKLDLAFPPVTDGNILVDDPINLLTAGKMNRVKIIFGFAQDENAASAVKLLGLDCPSVEKVEQKIQLVSNLSFSNPGLASEALTAEYGVGRGGLGDACKARGGFRRFMNDFRSQWTTLEAARIHANAGQPVYFYSFDQKPPLHYCKTLPTWAGPTSGDDLQFFFGDPYSPLVDDMQLAYRIQDREMTLELMTFLKNFIYTGEPGQSLSGIQWPKFDSTNLRYMSLADCPQAYSGHINNWEHTHRFWADVMATITSPTPSPQTSTVTPSLTCSPGPNSCTVESIGLSMTSDKASVLIKALLGSTVGAAVLVVLFFGGCIAVVFQMKRRKAVNGHNDSSYGLYIKDTGLDPTAKAKPDTEF